MIFLSVFLSERDFVRDFETKNWMYLGVFFHQKDKKRQFPTPFSDAQKLSKYFLYDFFKQKKQN